MADVVISRVYRNSEFVLWVKKEYGTAEEQKAAIAAFSWLKTRYPEIVPIVRGEMVSEDTQEVHHGRH